MDIEEGREEYFGDIVEKYFAEKMAEDDRQRAKAIEEGREEEYWRERNERQDRVWKKRREEDAEEERQRIKAFEEERVRTGWRQKFFARMRRETLEFLAQVAEERYWGLPVDDLYGPVSESRERPWNNEYVLETNAYHILVHLIRITTDADSEDGPSAASSRRAHTLLSEIIYDLE